MKLVINRCFGGFGVSRDALVLLAATSCPHVSRHEPEAYYGGEKFGDWRAQFAKDMERPIDGPFSRHLIIEGKIICDEHRPDAARGCPHLVALMETMCKPDDDRVSSQLAKLAIVEVPDGVEYVIDEYDGQESVEEAHRSWR